MTKASEYILDVEIYTKDTDDTVLVKCPHCARTLGLESGSFKGEQFFDKVCGGWLQVSPDAKFRSVQEVCGE